MIRSLFNRLVTAGALLACALATAPAHAGPFSGMFVFGDSLSDTGNLKLLSPSDYPPPAAGPYFDGRFSDGPVWVEGLAASLGLPNASNPYFAGMGGTNYAIAGARTGTDPSPPGILAQVGGIWNGVADPNALYIVVGGGNDLRDARTAFQTNSAADNAGRQSAAEAAVGNLAQSIGFLASRGAKHVLVSNVPDLGGTPEAVSLNLVDASTDATNRFNALIPGLLTTGSGLGLDVSFLDMAGLLQLVVTDATMNGGATYGITNVTSPCAGFIGSIGNACATSLFSDVLHPSAAAHALVAQAAFAAVVPEPQTYALLAIGLIAVALQGRRRLVKTASITA